MLVSKNSLLAKLISQTLQDLLKTKKEKLEDKGIKYHEFKIAQDGVTIAVNKDNDFVKELTKSQLKDIYSGKAKTWKDVNSSWPDKKSMLFHLTQVMVLTTSLKKKLWTNKISKLRRTLILTRSYLQ